MTPSLDLPHTCGTVLLPLTLWMERQILCSTLSKKEVGDKEKPTSPGLLGIPSGHDKCST